MVGIGVVLGQSVIVGDTVFSGVGFMLAVSDILV